MYDVLWEDSQLQGGTTCSGNGTPLMKGLIGLSSNNGLSDVGGFSNG